MGLDETGRALQCLLELCDGAVELFILCQRDAEVDSRLGVVGVVAQCLLEVREGRSPLPRAQVEHRQGVVGVPVGRVGGEERLVAVYFLLHPLTVEILFQSGQVRWVAGQNLQGQIAHPVGRVQAVAHPLGRIVWVAWVLCGVVVGVLHRDGRTFRK